jgi:hypothetical protein
MIGEHDVIRIEASPIIASVTSKLRRTDRQTFPNMRGEPVATKKCTANERKGVPVSSNRSRAFPTPGLSNQPVG